jgi:hypothetical protein
MDVYYLYLALQLNFMNTNISQPSYEDLVQIIANQKEEISELSKESATIANLTSI